MKRSVKKNYKLILGMIIGVIISGVGVYAAITISSSNISYDNSKSGLTSTNMKGAIDELYEKLKPCKVVSGTGKNIGDKIQCGTEYFYIINYSDSVTKMFAKDSIEQGAVTINSDGSPVRNISNPSNIQNSQCGHSNGFKVEGIEGMGIACVVTPPTTSTTVFSEYKKYLSLLGLSDQISIISISIQELNQLGCNLSAGTNSISGSCQSSPYSWVADGRYWLSNSSTYCAYGLSSGEPFCGTFDASLRPVVSIPTTYISISD